ncbi:hypothetical protein EC973_002117 [Apophysomyces ossiformis]|uniref:Uncharacterized protein n=1 Tax=Apophysomyces ossiformis TaxID=679940 RepID=A0A8H7ERF6_9FUNG|nr:hypothetical protein EC973_002117 [Apophysomyces ossiformis]
MTKELASVYPPKNIANVKLHIVNNMKTYLIYYTICDYTRENQRRKEHVDSEPETKKLIDEITSSKQPTCRSSLTL